MWGVREPLLLSQLGNCRPELLLQVNKLCQLPSSPCCMLLLQGIKLYYRVLESMLKVEEQRTGTTNFTSLLGRNSFHKCLLACAFETVASCYKIVRACFADLELLQLT